VDESNEPRVAVVTGAASGIGAAAAELIVAKGFRVVACDLKAARLEELASRFASAGLVTVQADVADPASVARLVAIATDLGPIAALANVAGIHDGYSPAHEVSDELWERIFAVDLTGPMRLCRAVLPGMMQRGAGSIVNVASIAGLRGGISGAAYTAAKHGLVGLTRSIGWMYARDGIRCNAVCPGRTETNIAETDVSRSDFGSSRLELTRVLAPRSAHPSEVAALVAWLAADESRNVNGAIIPCDAGWTAG
jgi:NAD(P)-dependent dehydrogenase (short-subunit alcohol dehydrogenase family)